MSHDHHGPLTIRDVMERLNQIEHKLNIMGKTLDDILTDVTDEVTLINSISALLSGIKAQLDAALAGGLSAAQQAKVDAIFAQVESNKKLVADAIAANTPAA